MTDILIRGYTLTSTINYIKEVGGNDGNRAMGSLSERTQKSLSNIAPAEWYPVSVLAELNRAIVTHMANDDEERAKDVLIACGKFMGREATNTFLRLLMKILTPNMLSKKFPDLWKRDCNGGRVEISVDDARIACAYFDLPGFDHVGVVGCGFTTFALESMGKTVERTIIKNWSLANPNQDGAAFELLWKT
jgi:hypothetical protein